MSYCGKVSTRNIIISTSTSHSRGAKRHYDYDHINNRNNNRHYIANDLLGTRIPITAQQYENCTPDNINELIK